MGAPDLIVIGYVAGLVIATWLFAQWAPPWRPPIGVFNGWDVALLLAVLVVLPWLYVSLPGAAAAALMVPAFLFVLHPALRRVLGPRAPALMLGAGVVAADIAVGVATGDRSNLHLLVNGLVLGAVVLGAATLIVASGISARSAATLAGLLAIGGVLGARLLATTAELMERGGGDPLLPLFGWWDGRDFMALGIADLLVAALFPLAARKAFGRRAGVVALGVSLAALAATIAIAGEDAAGDWPPLVALGPLALAQYAYWIRARGRERRTWENRVAGGGEIDEGTAPLLALRTVRRTDDGVHDGLEVGASDPAH